MEEVESPSEKGEEKRKSYSSVFVLCAHCLGQNLKHLHGCGEAGGHPGLWLTPTDSVQEGSQIGRNYRKSSQIGISNKQ